MELKRFFRGPLLLVLLAVLVITITLGWANSGSSYTAKDTGYVVKLIEQGQVKSAILTDKNQTIQVTTTDGKQYEADYISGRHVLIVEDIIDSGLTLSWLVSNLRSRDPASVAIAAMLRKPNSVQMDVEVAYTGFEIPDEFVVGYGLDYAERYRNLPFIGTLAPEVYGGNTSR